MLDSTTPQALEAPPMDPTTQADSAQRFVSGVGGVVMPETATGASDALSSNEFSGGLTNLTVEESQDSGAELIPTKHRRAIYYALDPTSGEFVRGSGNPDDSNDLASKAIASVVMTDPSDPFEALLTVSYLRIAAHDNAGRTDRVYDEPITAENCGEVLALAHEKGQKRLQTLRTAGKLSLDNL